MVYNLITLLLWWQHAEPSLDEFLPVQTQLELEHRHREEEDAMYRKFLQVTSSCRSSFIDKKHNVIRKDGSKKMWWPIWRRRNVRNCLRE